MNYTLEDSLQAWEANAEFWDNFMGECASSVQVI